MTFQKLNIPNGQSTLSGLVLYQSCTVTIHKQFGLSSVGFFFKKNLSFLYYLNNRTFQIKAQ